MLHLPTVTLLGIDSLHPKKTLRSLIFSKRQMQFARVVFVTDVAHVMFYRDDGRSLRTPLPVKDVCAAHGIELIHHVTGGRKEYEYDMLERTPDYFDTSHVLFQEWDAAVMNPSAWMEDFLRYDFTGAPWVPGAEEERWWVGGEHKVVPAHAAPVTNRSNNVGNGGFSLKSKTFCREVAKRVDRRNGHQLCSDAWMCRTLRPEMERIGIRYAPEDVAERFSCEDRFYSGQFGMHGQETIRMNNWNWNFEFLIP